MSYPKKTFKLRPRGVRLDVIASDVDTEQKQFWTKSRNVFSRGMQTVRANGCERIYLYPQDDPDFADQILAMSNIVINGTNYWIYHTSTASWVVQTSIHTDITLSGGFSNPATNPVWWQTPALNGVPLMNNQQDAPQYWDGDITHQFVALPDFPAGTTAKVIVPYKYHIVALNISGPDGAPDLVQWSDGADPGSVPASWTPGPGNEAGANPLSDTPGEIIGGATLRDKLLIYKQTATHSMTYTGTSPLYFKFETVFTNRGALNARCIADIGGGHFVVGNGDIYISDGVSANSIADGWVKDKLFNQLTQENYALVFVKYYPQENEVWVCYPTSNSGLCDRAFVYDIATQEWGETDLPYINCLATGIVNDTSPSDIIDGYTTTFVDDMDRPFDEQNFSLLRQVLVAGGQFMYQMDFGSDFVGAPVTAYAIKEAISLGKPEQIKYIRRLFPRVTGIPGTEIKIRIGTQMDVSGSTTWTAPVSYIIGTDNKVDCRAQGKFISIEISSVGGSPWQMTGIDAEVELRGYR